MDRKGPNERLEDAQLLDEIRDGMVIVVTWRGSKLSRNMSRSRQRSKASSRESRSRRVQDVDARYSSNQAKVVDLDDEKEQAEENEAEERLLMSYPGSLPL